jgi:hypothetical protein
MEIDDYICEVKGVALIVFLSVVHHQVRLFLKANLLDGVQPR